MEQLGALVRSVLATSDATDVRITHALGARPRVEVERELVGVATLVVTVDREQSDEAVGADLLRAFIEGAHALAGPVRLDVVR